jgi:hypothetical protein
VQYADEQGNKDILLGSSKVSPHTFLSAEQTWYNYIILPVVMYFIIEHK